MTGAPELRRLGQRDRCGGFSSGHEALDTYFRQYAKQSERRGLAATTVAWIDGEIAGFVTVVASGVDPSPLRGLVQGLSRQPAPVLVLARMACDARYQRRGIGAVMLRDVVFAGALDMHARFGCAGVFVDAKPDAVSFYARYDFVTLVSATPHDDTATPGRTSTPMFLPMETLRRAMTPSQ